VLGTAPSSPTLRGLRPNDPITRARPRILPTARVPVFGRSTRAQEGMNGYGRQNPSG